MQTVVDRLRIIPKSDTVLQSTKGSVGEIFYSKEGNTLRIYNGNDNGGTELLTSGNIGSKLTQLNIATITYDIILLNNTYFISGETSPELNLVYGFTYKFDQSNESNLNFPIKFTLNNDPDDPIITDNLRYFLDNIEVLSTEYYERFDLATTRYISFLATTRYTQLWYFSYDGSLVGNSVTLSMPGTGSGSASSLTILTDPPEEPNNGDLWLDSDTGNLFVYFIDQNEEGNWIQPITGVADGTTSVTVDDTPPAGVLGRLHFNPLTDLLYLYTDEGWTQLDKGIESGAGIAVTNNPESGAYVIGIGTLSSISVEDGIISITNTNNNDARIEFNSSTGNGNGWIGIPDWNPDALYIYAPNGSGGNTPILNFTDQSLKLLTENTTRFTVKQDGDIDVAKNLNVLGNCTVTGDLTVQGDTVSINVESLLVEDKNIYVATLSENRNESSGAGITVNLGADGTATLTYDGPSDSWACNKPFTPPTLRVNAPADQWNFFDFYSTQGYGQLYHSGSYRTSITSNGYRNDTTTWTSYAANGFEGASQIDCDPQGILYFRTQAQKLDGESPVITERLRITDTQSLFTNEVKATGVSGSFVSENHFVAETGNLYFSTNNWHIGREDGGVDNDRLVLYYDNVKVIRLYDTGRFTTFDPAGNVIADIDVDGSTSIYNTTTSDKLMELDSSGNLKVKGDVTAFATL